MGRISKSATGETYLAYRGERRDERWYSLKLLSAIVERQPELLAKVDQEISRSESLQHPSIVSVEDTVAAASQRLVVFPWIRGVALSAPIWHTSEGDSALRWDLAVHVFSQVCQALRGVVHEDHAGVRVHGAIIPQNVVVDAAGDAYVLNLGLDVLRAGAQDLTMVYPFRAPEVRASGKMTAAADVFGVGVCMLEMIAVGSARKLLENPLQTSEVVDMACTRTQCPTTLSALIARAVAVDPARRFVSLASLADALQRVPLVLETPDLKRDLVASLRDERDIGFDRPPAMETAELRIADLAEKARIAELSTDTGLSSPPESSDATERKVATDALSEGVVSMPQPELPRPARPGWLAFVVAAILVGLASIGVWFMAGSSDEVPVVVEGVSGSRSADRTPVATVVSDEPGRARSSETASAKAGRKNSGAVGSTALKLADAGQRAVDAAAAARDAAAEAAVDSDEFAESSEADETSGSGPGGARSKRRKGASQRRHKKKLLANPGF